MSSPNFRLSGPSLGYWTVCNNFKRYCTVPYCVLGLRPANERRRYFVTTSLISWAQAENLSNSRRTARHMLLNTMIYHSGYQYKLVMMKITPHGYRIVSLAATILWHAISIYFLTAHMLRFFHVLRYDSKLFGNMASYNGHEVSFSHHRVGYCLLGAGIFSTLSQSIHYVTKWSWKEESPRLCMTVIIIYINSQIFKNPTITHDTPV